MGVNLIFKIAAVGILVSVICQVLKHKRKGGPGRFSPAWRGWYWCSSGSFLTYMSCLKP